ncbi:MAG: lysine--tRNA ligase [Neisseriales bacterium]|nr:MAG: lysine--tRNA ligase [Neisseriales bacterium]
MTTTTPKMISEPATDENQVITERRHKLTALQQVGNAYPNDFRRSHFAQLLHTEFGLLDKTQLAEKPITVSVAGRMMLKRLMGKASFASLQDQSGTIQLYISDQSIGHVAHQAFKAWDLGDILGATGVLFKTNTDELTIRVTTVRMLTKTIRPLPEKFHGLSDQEQKYRQRYVDLIVNAATRENFIKRSQIVQAMRQFMVDEGYLEVETPMMHPIPGGAAAKPFITHHNALDMPLYLRISPELYLKRLVVGGLERVFEINRSFRNEGLSTKHNPEFTMMEFYEAYCNYERMMQMAESIIRNCATLVCHTQVIAYNQHTIDLCKPFLRLTITEAIQHYNPQYQANDLADIAWLTKTLAKLQQTLPINPTLGNLQLALFEASTEKQLQQPTFIINYPTEVSPLARAADHNAAITERFELFIAGAEIANGFSELNDPQEQAKRFMEQVKQKEAGDEEAMYFDADYIRALEYGLPPTGGCGIGIDRLAMLLTNAPSIRDIILFPTLRTE